MKRQIVLGVMTAVAGFAGCGEGGAEEVSTRVHRLVVQDGNVPQTLSGTGLYTDITTRTLAPGVVEFRPRHQLWTDGAQKRRFISLPPGAQIDTSDMDHWHFPVGTRLWKEFARDGVPLETRFLEITGNNDDHYLGAYAWDADGAEARLAEGGAQNVLGTDHDIPSAGQCGTCHRGEPGRVLGFSALQLSKPAGEGPTLQEIAAAGWLSAPPPPAVDYPAPGDERTSSAMGVLHANCGHCHNPRGTLQFNRVDMILRLSVTEGDPQQTELWRTTVGRALQDFRSDGIPNRITPGSAATSAVTFRMAARGNQAQMPYVGTKHVDDVGLARVSAWIDSLGGGSMPPTTEPPAPQPEPAPQPNPAPQPEPAPQPNPAPQPEPEPQPEPQGGEEPPPPDSSPDHEDLGGELRASAET